MAEDPSLSIIRHSRSEPDAESVSPAIFGGGNKLSHNVTGGIGVVEGNGGPLRAGLPWQSVHDGEDYAHEPLRLSVCIEAPRQAMSDVLSRHVNVRALFDNGWLHLSALDDQGHMACPDRRAGVWIQRSKRYSFASLTMLGKGQERK